MVRQLPLSIYCCAKFTAVVVATLSCALFTFWAANEAAPDSSRPPSFLQMAQASRLRRRQGRQGPACPAELQRRNPDCRVVKVRASLHLGGNSARPTETSMMMWTAVDPSLLSDAESIIGWKPVMKDVKSQCRGETKQVSLVHHINIYAYNAKTSLTVGRAYIVGHDATPDIEDETLRMLASHDKEAGDYFLPDRYGIPLGKQALMERHVLFPKCWDHQHDVVESSGMDLYVVPSYSMKPAALVGALNFNMDVQPQQGPVEWITRMPSEKLKSFVSEDSHEWPEILAVHLHTHDVARSKFFEILNQDGSVAFKSAKEKAGYGLQEQSFANLADKGWPRLRLHAGQQLLQHCLFDSDALAEPVEYGLNWGQEMCAPLLVVGGTNVRPMPTVLSSTDGYLSRFHVLLEDAVSDMKRLLSELRSTQGFF